MGFLRQALVAAILLIAIAPHARPDASDRARQLVERTIANQHRDDAALYDYERVEERITYQDHSIASDEIFRLVPTGTGRLSLLIKRDNRPVDLAFYQRQLRAWQDALHVALDPGSPAERQLEAKRRERDRKRNEMIDSIGRAFSFKWLGEEKENGRTLAKIELDPNPSFQPTSRETQMLRHVRATAWIDERSAQLVRAHADIIGNIAVAGGVVAKIYSGGWFEIEQARFAPGIWFPTRTEYSIHGRMFLVSVSEHKLEKEWGYRWIGPPQQALEVARRDLASNSLFSLDP